MFLSDWLQLGSVQEGKGLLGTPSFSGLAAAEQEWLEPRQGAGPAGRNTNPASLPSEESQIRVLSAVSNASSFWKLSLQLV